MSLSVKENRLVAVNRLGENSLQTVLQGKVELPSTAAPVGRIVWVKGTPVVQSTNIEQDRVFVQGAIDLAMVYVPETLEGEPAGLRRVEWPGALPFEQELDVLGAEREMYCEVETELLVCEWDLRPGQFGLDVDVILATTVRIAREVTYTAIGDVNMAKPVKLTTDGLVLNPLPPPMRLPVKKEITGILDFPTEDGAAAQTILQINATVQIKEREITKGKLVVKGAASLDVLYEQTDLAIKAERFVNVLPFELSFEKAKIEADLVLREVLAASCEGIVVNDGKNLRVELEVTGDLVLQKRQAVQVITEINTPGNQVEVRKELIHLDSFVNEKEQQGVVRGLIELTQQLPSIRELLQSRAVAHLLDYEVDEDKLSYDGVLDVEIFYLAHSEEDTKPLYRGLFAETIPFQQTMALPGLEPGMQPKIKLEVVQVQPDLINRETVEVAITLRTFVQVVEYVELEVAVEAVEVAPPPADPPTLTYVFVQSGDSIWKLARQYHSTEEAILKANPTLQGNPALLKPGDRLYIPK